MRTYTTKHTIITGCLQNAGIEHYEGYLSHTTDSDGNTAVTVDNWLLRYFLQDNHRKAGIVIDKIDYGISVETELHLTAYGCDENIYNAKGYVLYDVERRGFTYYWHDKETLTEEGPHTCHNSIKHAEQNAWATYNSFIKAITNDA